MKSRPKQLPQSLHFMLLVMSEEPQESLQKNICIDCCWEIRVYEFCSYSIKSALSNTSGNWKVRTFRSNSKWLYLFTWVTTDQLLKTRVTCRYKPGNITYPFLKGAMTFIFYFYLEEKDAKSYFKNNEVTALWDNSSSSSTHVILFFRALRLVQAPAGIMMVLCCTVL